jgi:hypothetical protein
VAGTNTLSFTVPAGAMVTPTTWARFRFSAAADLAFTGEALNGEVEDCHVAMLDNLPLVVRRTSMLSGADLALSGTGTASTNSSTG